MNHDRSTLHESETAESMKNTDLEQELLESPPIPVPTSGSSSTHHSTPTIQQPITLEDIMGVQTRILWDLMRSTSSKPTGVSTDMPVECSTGETCRKTPKIHQAPIPELSTISINSLNIGSKSKESTTIGATNNMDATDPSTSSQLPRTPFEANNFVVASPVHDLTNNVSRISDVITLFDNPSRVIPPTNVNNTVNNPNTDTVTSFGALPDSLNSPANVNTELWKHITTLLSQKAMPTTNKPSYTGQAHEDPNTFLEQFDVFARGACCPDEKWLTLVLDCLGGFPRQWAYLHKAGWLSFHELKLAFLELFWSEAQQQIVRRKLMTNFYKPTGKMTMFQYYITWFSRAQFLSVPIPEAVLVSDLMCHFPHNVRTNWSLTGGNTHQQALEFLRRYQEPAVALNDRQSRFSQSTVAQQGGNRRTVAEQSSHSATTQPQPNTPSRPYSYRQINTVQHNSIRPTPYSRFTRGTGQRPQLSRQRSRRNQFNLSNDGSIRSGVSTSV